MDSFFKLEPFNCHRVLPWFACLLWFWCGPLFSQVPENGTAQSMYDEGIAILQSEGAEAAIAFFEGHVLESNDLTALWGEAWAFWVRGNLSIAERINDYVFDHCWNPALIANCHYLYGCINISKGDFEQGRVHFRKSLEYFTLKKKYKDQFRAITGLATASMKLGELREAKDLLEDALLLNKHAKMNLGHYYELWTWVSYTEKDYRNALSYAKESFEEYEKASDEQRKIAMLSSIGFFHLSIGNFQKGLEITEQVEAIAKEKGWYKTIAYNLINWLIIYKCSGINPQDPITRIEFWIQKESDQLLEDYLHDVLKMDCVYQ